MILWYLSSELVAFSFFHDSVDKQIKIMMASKLTSASEDDYNYDDDRDIKAVLSTEQVNGILDKELDYFVAARTQNFFRRFDIDTEFLMTDPNDWH